MVAGDPLLTSQVQAILANPVAAQRPDLVHFRPQPAGAAGPGDTGSTGGPRPAATSGSRLLLLGIAGGAAALLAAAVVVTWRRVRTGFTRRLRLALLAVPLVGAVPAAALAAVTAAPRAASISSASIASAAIAAPHGSLLSGLRSHSVSLPAGAASRIWTSLLSIETELVSQHDRLAADEQQITTMTQELSGATTTTPAAEPRRPATPAELKAALEQAVSDHQATLSSYNTSLQSEYRFFVSTAQSPEASTELKSVAAHTPLDVQQAVTTNLDLVATQLQQEAQIAAAAATAAAQAQSQAQSAASSGTLPPVVANLSGPAPSFHAPVSGVLSQPFGPTQFSLEPPVTYNGVFYPHFHTGLDIAAPLDTPLQAAAPGIVLLATSSFDPQGHLSGYGNYVVIAHADGFLTLYGHMDKLLVKAGQKVDQGDVIGLLGSTGWSTGPHVHFEVRKNNAYVDPAPYLAADLKH